MTKDALAGVEWETIGGIGVDSAACAFGDADALGEQFRLTPGDDPSDFEPYLVVCGTGADIDVPVEVVRAEDGQVVAARMNFTDDVDELDGTWAVAGRLDLRSGRCLAGDPYYTPHEHYRLVFDAAPGVYLAEFFDFTDEDGEADRLGLRVRLSEEPRHSS